MTFTSRNNKQNLNDYNEKRAVVSLQISLNENISKIRELLR
jgi:hypothetical protein